MKSAARQHRKAAGEAAEVGSVASRGNNSRVTKPQPPVKTDEAAYN